MRHQGRATLRLLLRAPPLRLRPCPLRVLVLRALVRAEDGDGPLPPRRHRIPAGMQRCARQPHVHGTPPVATSRRLGRCHFQQLQDNVACLVTVHHVLAQTVARAHRRRVRVHSSRRRARERACHDRSQPRGGGGVRGRRAQHPQHANVTVTVACGAWQGQQQLKRHAALPRAPVRADQRCDLLL